MSGRTCIARGSRRVHAPGSSRMKGSPHGRGRSRRAGYTLIEVMMAVGIMTVGSVGIMGLEQATTRGNIVARQMTTGTEITRTWLERMRGDSLMWTSPAPGALAGTHYLKNVPAPGTAVSPWLTPTPPSGSSDSYAFDWFGNDMTPTGTKHPIYCVNVRLSWASPTDDAIRVDVRTWWHRRSTGQSGGADESSFADCAVGGEGAVTTALATGTSLEDVEASTLVRWHEMSP